MSGDAERVTRIAATIAEVATQTDILAIDAVIEAARAREHGRGVAVVAESARLVAAIAVAMEEQGVTIGSLGERVATLHRIGQSNAAAAEEITVTMIDLSRLAGDTRRVVESLAMTEESPAS